ncbi:hypothetical protein AUC68_01980 [Methyloceanibacter methanicus]|uniref:Invasion associated locus B family protein n=2 Tax=Methyloceanibacter methanicus TaxID=1774968 RepID=A0A1E3W452_9HYPH|nr:hypothetical protein AUC68_01980 [Methyloceanibacter methanicus]
MVLAIFAVALLFSAGAGTAQAQSSAAQKTKPAPQASATPAKPVARVAGGYGHWTMLCGKEGDPGTAEERCSLVLPLIEKETQKLIFRVILTYGPQGRFVLRVDGPTGVALQRGVEFSTDTGTTYRMPFQTCLPMGCKALFLVPDDMLQELSKSKQATIVVYALNGRAIQTVAELEGLPLGLEALDEKRMALVSKKK